MLKGKKDSIRLVYESWKLGGCVYVCPICGTAVRHSVKLIRHLSKEHDIVKSKDRHLSRVVTKHIKCLGCGKRMLYDYGAMKAHFRDYDHTIEGFEGKIDLPQYFLHYIYFGQDEKEFFFSNSITKERAETEDVNSGPLVTEEVVNLCHYQCPVCSTKLEGIKELYMHVNQDHQRTFKSLNVKRKDLLTKFAYHRCRICGRSDIYCDKIAITDHVKHRHNTKLTQYIKDGECT